VDAAQRQLSDQLDHATQRLLGTARGIPDSELRQPSLLPGWTRGHVLTHLARNADAMRNVLAGARSGEERRMYGSLEGREEEIEQGAGRGSKELADDLASSAMALRTVMLGLPDDAWQFPVRVPDSGPFPAAQLLPRRLVEVELHHVDLDYGYGPGDWPAAFATMDLPEPLGSLRRDRLQRA
jgi:maleylpyruvate isomerase